jgi:hypothetical protein
VDHVNTYDPMDGIVYRHVGHQGALASLAVLGAPLPNRLPSDYPNASPSTYLGSRRRAHTGAASPSGVTTSHVPPKSSTSWQSTSPGSSSA